jgi:hypothetical protein
MELEVLTEFIRNASLGYEYTELNSIYPSWAIDLHNFGDIMDKEQLELISTYGIISWYLEYHTKINVCYPYYNKLMEFTDNIYSISYYDMTQLNKLAIKYNIPLIKEHKSNNKYMEHLLMKNIEKYGHIKWIEYIIIEFEFLDSIIFEPLMLKK